MSKCNQFENEGSKRNQEILKTKDPKEIRKSRMLYC